MKTLSIFIISLAISISVYSQEYIVFEEQKGANSRELLQGLKLSLNSVELDSGDTSITLYNWFFSPQVGFNWKSLSPSLSILSQKLLNNLVIVAAPIGQTERRKSFRKLSAQELEKLEVITIDTLLGRSLLDLNKHTLPRTVYMPPLKTIQYGLIVKRGQDFYLIQSPILITYFVVSYEPVYFPNEFRNGTLAINPNNATYDFKTIDNIEKEFRKKELPHKWLEKIVDRVYLSNIDLMVPLNKSIFSFWEYPNEDVMSSLLNLKNLHEFNMGLGSFQYIDGIGIVNATLDTFLKHKILFQQKPYFKIKNINGMELDKFILQMQKR
ncbi:hypothetical protein [Pedobacter sp. ASV28]|uniref:hypothetical protein n=1 Tax=Pedobacter sp. ASV28 TaxID=2795123 RepID=UPI0018EC52F5|nr:hypothetical protein [Pedobacter sp. ASV28]